MMKILFVSLFFIIGCSSGQHVRFKNDYMGKTDEQIINQAGVPDSIYESCEAKHFVYNDITQPKSGENAPNSYTKTARKDNTYDSFSNSGNSSYCTTTLDLQQGKVVGYHSYGNGCN